MSEAFSCLFDSCGRNPIRTPKGKPEVDYTYAEFNRACTSREQLERQLGIKIPGPDILPSAEDTRDVLTNRDRYLFGYQAEWNSSPYMKLNAPVGRLVDPVYE